MLYSNGWFEKMNGNVSGFILSLLGRWLQWSDRSRTVQPQIDGLMAAQDTAQMDILELFIVMDLAEDQQLQEIVWNRFTTINILTLWSSYWWCNINYVEIAGLNQHEIYFWNTFSFMMAHRHNIWDFHFWLMGTRGHKTLWRGEREKPLYYQFVGTENRFREELQINSIPGTETTIEFFHFTICLSHLNIQS